MTDRYDVVYYSTHTTIEPHFCREYDCNEEHGFTLEEACNQVADWYQQQAEQWRSQNHYDILYYKSEK
jgi:hypothetical protein